MNEWMSVYSEWMSEYDEWLSVYDEWLSIYDEWIQWVLGVCKDMNGDCVWRLLGDCRCDRMQIQLCCHIIYTNYCMWRYTTCVCLFKINCQTDKLSNCVMYYCIWRSVHVRNHWSKSDYGHSQRLTCW